MKYALTLTSLLALTLLGGCADVERRAQLEKEIALLEVERTKLEAELAALQKALAEEPPPPAPREADTDQADVNDAYNRLAATLEGCEAPCAKTWRMKARSVESWPEVDEGMRKSFMLCVSRCREAK